MFLLGYAAYYKNHAHRTYYNTSVSSVESFACVYRLHHWVDMHAYVISADAMQKYSGEKTRSRGSPISPRPAATVWHACARRMGPTRTVSSPASAAIHAPFDATPPRAARRHVMRCSPRRAALAYDAERPIDYLISFDLDEGKFFTTRPQSAFQRIHPPVLGQSGTLGTGGPIQTVLQDPDYVYTFIDPALYAHTPKAPHCLPRLAARENTAAFDALPATLASLPANQAREVIARLPMGRDYSEQI